MGDNVYLGDRDGVRTPMQWSADRNAGFSRANPQQLYLPVDHRPRVPLRGGQRRGPAGQPDLAAVVDAPHDRAAPAAPGVRPRRASSSSHPDNPHVLAFVRALEDDERARRRQPLALRAVVSSSTSSRARGARPVELFGQTRFPTIGDLPYLLTLGPARLLLVRARAAAGADRPRATRPTVRSAAAVDRRPRAHADRRRSTRRCASFLPSQRLVRAARPRSARDRDRRRRAPSGRRHRRAAIASVDDRATPTASPSATCCRSRSPTGDGSRARSTGPGRTWCWPTSTAARPAVCSSTPGAAATMRCCTAMIAGRRRLRARDAAPRCAAVSSPTALRLPVRPLARGRATRSTRHRSAGPSSRTARSCSATS